MILSAGFSEPKVLLQAPYPSTSLVVHDSVGQGGGGCSKFEKFVTLEIFFGQALVLERGTVEALVIILALDVLFFAAAYGIEWNGINGVVSHV